MEYLKKVLYLIFPPIITKLFKSSSYQYKSKFDTYSKAKEASSIYYDKNSTKKFLGPDDVEVSGRFNIIPLLALSLKKKNIKILDYGGGANPVYSYIENATNIKTKTYVIEQENFCNVIKRKIPNKFKKYIKYESSIKKLNQKYFDIICFNSSLQYLENYESLVSRLIKFNPIFMWTYPIFTKSGL